MLPPLPPLVLDAPAEEKRSQGNPDWVKGGSSPNPGGRPKRLAALAEKISAFDDEALAILERIAKGGKGIKAGEQVQAIKLMWSYGHGNPVQAVTGPDGEGLKLGVVILPAEET